MSLIELVSRSLIFWGIVLLIAPLQESRADVITMETEVVSINPSDGTIKVNRKGKELTLEMSRQVEVVIGNKKATLTNVISGQRVEIDSLDDLPTGPVTIIGIDLKNNRIIDDADLARLSELQYIENLNLDGTVISDEGLRHLSGLTSQSEVRCSYVSRQSNVAGIGWWGRWIFG